MHPRVNQQLVEFLLKGRKPSFSASYLNKLDVHTLVSIWKAVENNPSINDIWRAQLAVLINDEKIAVDIVNTMASENLIIKIAEHFPKIAHYALSRVMTVKTLEAFATSVNYTSIADQLYQRINELER